MLGLPQIIIIFFFNGTSKIIFPASGDKGKITIIEPTGTPYHTATILGEIHFILYFPNL